MKCWMRVASASARMAAPGRTSQATWPTMRCDGGWRRHRDGGASTTRSPGVHASQESDREPAARHRRRGAPMDTSSAAAVSAPATRSSSPCAIRSCPGRSGLHRPRDYIGPYRTSALNVSEKSTYRHCVDPSNSNPLTGSVIGRLGDRRSALPAGRAEAAANRNGHVVHAVGLADAVERRRRRVRCGREGPSEGCRSRRSESSNRPGSMPAVGSDPGTLAITLETFQIGFHKAAGIRRRAHGAPRRRVRGAPRVVLAFELVVVRRSRGRRGQRT